MFTLSSFRVNDAGYSHILGAIEQVRVALEISQEVREELTDGSRESQSSRR